MKFSDFDIEYKTLDCIDFFSGLVTILSFLIQMIEGFLQMIGIDISLVFLNLDFAKIGLFGFCVILIIKLIKYRKTVEEFRKITNHIEHAIQVATDEYFKMIKNHNNKSMNIEILSDLIKRDCETLLNELCEIFKKITGEDINACIKLITDDCCSTKTFYRSTINENRNYRKRKSRDLDKTVPFAKNTDFDIIVNNNEDYFYVSDLNEYKRKNIYSNSNEDYKEYYNGTIVVPIKISTDCIHFCTQSSEYHLIGFLCVDSMSTRAFSIRQKDYNLNIMFTFSNIFYIILNKYKYYLKKYENTKKGEA